MEARLPSGGRAMNAASVNFSEHHVPRDQGTIYARDYAGTGPAFVLMHGFPDNLHIYDDLVPHLVAAGRRVVTFDFLGFGASDRPAGAAYSFRQQLGDLEAIVAALGLGKVVPVGHDAGGPAAINFAIEHPDLVESLCILNSFYGAAPGIRLPELIKIFATPSLKAFADALLQSPEQVAWLLGFQQKMFMAAMPEGQKAHFASVLVPIITNGFLQAPSAGPAFAQMAAETFPEVTRNTARLPQMAALDIPVKLIWGEADPYLHAGVAEDFRSHFKRATLDLLPAGHWLQIDMPEQVAAIMLAARS
jgi:haloalkane dehalogenase